MAKNCQIEGRKSRNCSQKSNSQPAQYPTAQPFMDTDNTFGPAMPFFLDTHPQGHAAHHARAAETVFYPDEYFLPDGQAYTEDTAATITSTQPQDVSVEFPSSDWDSLGLASYQDQYPDDNREAVSSDSPASDDEGTDPARRRRAANCIAARRHAQKKKKQVAEMEDCMAKLDAQINEEKKKREKLLETMHTMQARVEMARFQRAYSDPFVAQGTQA
ncbi:hypothetical protein CYLTODRAFT_27555 [Cylindrobasidium torrendii FP15055 ss-10]|uniref:BZIP domain-containing protein n=1 Tax=Cylindrobasidium torrendii FP15055 ss-10 TaxID=1314674 RepID=A0A0D7BPQ0_9AGAR|nr:hypothetical protein CYLTODRAFT_27555 [Cylindrobasidium torrendii FP15055 ss-10]